MVYSRVFYYQERALKYDPEHNISRLQEGLIINDDHGSWFLNAEIASKKHSRVPRTVSFQGIVYRIESVALDIVPDGLIVIIILSESVRLGSPKILNEKQD